MVTTFLLNTHHNFTGDIKFTFANTFYLSAFKEVTKTSSQQEWL